MLRYKTETRPGLVALYDIWPGNGVGQLLQPRSPHGAGSSVILPAAHHKRITVVLQSWHYIYYVSYVSCVILYCCLLGPLFMYC